MQEKVNQKFNKALKDFHILRLQYFNEFKEDRKSFAIQNKDNYIFPLVMRSLNVPESGLNSEAKKLVKDFILKKTNKLNKAKEFLNG